MSDNNPGTRARQHSTKRPSAAAAPGPKSIERHSWRRFVVPLLSCAAFPFILASTCDLPAEAGSIQSPRFEKPPPPLPIRTQPLRVLDNRIVMEDGSVWIGRGMNIHDTRSCNACTSQPPNVAEVNRRIDEAVDVWGANFLRLNMESYGRGGPNSDPITMDGDYLDDIVAIIDHIGTKQDVYVLLSLWHDPTFTSLGWPSPETADTWEILTIALQDRPHVMFGLVNEPQANYDGALDYQVWSAMNDTVARVRSVEQGLGLEPRIIAVQGTRGWARWLDYYVDNPIEAGGGVNIVYETHVYNSSRDFQALFEEPSRTLPVIIGEFGPYQASSMTLEDTAALMERAEALQIPFLAWTFHQRCPPNLLMENSGGGCGVDMALEPTQWGRQLMEHLENFPR